MVRIDLDDLPPKVARLLISAEPGQEVLLVQDGLVLARLAGAAAPARAPEPAPPEDPQRQHEIFEQFRSMMEDDF